MSEFRKPYEYEEAKGMGGLLMLFFLMLLSVEVPLAALVMMQGYAALKALRYLGPAFLVLGTGYLLFIIVTCIALRRMSRHAVVLAKLLLAVRVLFLTPTYLLLADRFSRDPGLLSGFRSRSDFVMLVLVLPLAYILSFSGLWFWYLSSSRRVRQFVQTASARRVGSRDGLSGHR